MRSNSAESMEKKESSPTPLTKSNIAPKVNQETRGIAALAAAKKRRQQQEIMSSRLNLQDSRTFVSTYDDDRKLTPSRLANHNLKYGSRYNMNDEAEDTYDSRSQHTDTGPYHSRKNDSSPARTGGKIPRASKHRHQSMLRVHNNAAAALPSSNSDRLSDKVSLDTPSKVGAM